MKLLIAIPALNEEQSIRSIIERSLAAKKHIIENSPVTAIDITVVSDGSTDATVDRAREFGDKIKLIVFPKNRGYGAAIMEAWNQSDAELLSFLDADGTCDPKFFAPLCRKLEEEKADIVLGCRLNKDSRMPPIRRFGNTIFAWLLSALSSETVKDTASGMRVVRRSALRHIYPLPTGLHFTPAMSARAMLSDAARIVEIDMPYAEREGRSKLSVLKDGIRFLKVILSSALLYRPGKLLLVGASLISVLAAALMIHPSFYYLQTHTVAEWMIYRFLVSALLGQVALMLWGAAVLMTRIASIAIHEEVLPARPSYSQWLRTRGFWIIPAILVLVAGVLVWPSAVQLLQTGHTDVHWSRFVISMASLGAAVQLVVIRGMDGLLDMVERRVQFLWQND